MFYSRVEVEELQIKISVSDNGAVHNIFAGQEHINSTLIISLKQVKNQKVYYLSLQPKIKLEIKTIK